MSVCLVASLISLSLAISPVFPESVVGNSSTISHGDSLEIKFNLNNNDTTSPLGNVKIMLPSLSMGQWTSAKLGSDNLQISGNQIDLGSLKIANKTSSNQFSLIFKTNRFSSPSAISSQISFSGKFEPSGAIAPIDSLPFSFTIKSEPSLSVTKIKDLTKTQNGTINVTNNGNTIINNIDLSSSGSLNITLSPSNSFNLISGESKLINVLLDSSIISRFGTQTAVVTAMSGDVKPTVSFSLKESFCKNGQQSSNLSIRNAEFTEYNEDDDVWKFLDKLTLEVEVENNANDDVDDIIVELALFNDKGENVVDGLDFSNNDEEKIDLGDINEDDEEVVTFEFTVPADFEEGDYKLAVKAYSDRNKEENVCIDTSGDFDQSFYQTIKVEKETDEGHFIAFDNLRLTPSEATCGDQVSLSTDVFNIGDEDQDQVRVNLYSKALNIDLSNEIRNNLDQGDKEKIIFNFVVPSGIADKTYNLELSSEYDYKNGVYRAQSDENVLVPVKVLGCSVQPSSSDKFVSITADLGSEAKAGKEMIVKATIRNIGNASAAFAIEAKNFESWSKLGKAYNRILTLSPGESGDVEISFMVNSDASGENLFNIEVASSGAKTETKEISVNIAKGSNSFSNLFKGNALAWVIGLVNLLLIVIIIIVAVKIAKR